MAENEPRRDPKSPQDARLVSLDERLRRAQAQEAERTGPAVRAAATGQAQGMRILSVLFGYPLGSAAIGWAIDWWAGTKWVWMAMLVLGLGAAIREVWKISQQTPQ